MKEKRVSVFDLSVDLNQDDFYLPSVDLLTAQVRPQTHAKTPASAKSPPSVRLLGSSVI